MSGSKQRMDGVAHVREQKKEIRNAMRSQRDAIPEEERKSASEAICLEVLRSIPYRYAKRVLLYAPFGSEADVFYLLDTALNDGKEVYFPKTEGKGVMRFFRISCREELVCGRFGILSPDGTTEEYVGGADTDLCIVPGISFDADGFRIGYGGGYYDRFFTGFAGVRAGVCFASLVMREGALPREKRYDKKVDVLYTEREVTVFGV